MNNGTDPEEQMEEQEILELLNKRNNWSLDEVIELVLLKNRTLIIYGELTENLCNDVCQRLLFLFYRGIRKINIILNSVGGDVFHGLLIFDTIEDLKSKGMEICIEARGLCASMGVIVLVSGSKRMASKYTRFLLHEITSTTCGKASEIKEDSQETGKVNKLLNEIISTKSKLSMKEIVKNTKGHNWWFSAEEAVKYGLIETVI